jgi:hypothetical protein
VCFAWTSEQWSKLRSSRSYNSRRHNLLSKIQRESLLNTTIPIMSSANSSSALKPKADKSAVLPSVMPVVKGKKAASAASSSSVLPVKATPVKAASAVKPCAKTVKPSSTVSKPAIGPLPPVSQHKVPIEVTEFHAPPMSQDQFMHLMDNYMAKNMGNRPGVLAPESSVSSQSVAPQTVVASLVVSRSVPVQSNAVPSQLSVTGKSVSKSSLVVSKAASERVCAVTTNEGDTSPGVVTRAMSTTTSNRVSDRPVAGDDRSRSPDRRQREPLRPEVDRYRDWLEDKRRDWFRLEHDRVLAADFGLDAVCGTDRRLDAVCGTDRLLDAVLGTDRGPEVRSVPGADRRDDGVAQTDRVSLDRVRSDRSPTDRQLLRDRQGTDDRAMYPDRGLNSDRRSGDRQPAEARSLDSSGVRRAADVRRPGDDRQPGGSSKADDDHPSSDRRSRDDRRLDDDRRHDRGQQSISDRQRVDDRRLRNNHTSSTSSSAVRSSSSEHRRQSNQQQNDDRQSDRDRSSSFDRNLGNDRRPVSNDDQRSSTDRQRDADRQRDLDRQRDDDRRSGRDRSTYDNRGSGNHASSGSRDGNVDDRNISSSHRYRSRSPTSPRRSSSRRSNNDLSSDEASDAVTAEAVDEGRNDEAYQPFKEFLKSCMIFLGEDMPPVTARPRPDILMSAFQDDPSAREPYQHLGVPTLVTTAFKHTRRNFFGGEPLSATSDTPFPVNPLEKKFGKLPPFKSRFYRTDDALLQDGPKLVDPNASSLWPDAGKDKAKTIPIDRKVLQNMGVAAERSCMTITYFEFFAAVMSKAFGIMKDKDSTTEAQRNAALDLADRARLSMGRCLIDVTINQAYVLTASTLTSRDAVLERHKSVLPKEGSDWMRAQPVLTGKSLFGPVAEKVKVLQEEQRSRRRDDAVSSISRQNRAHPYRQSSSSQKPRGGRNESAYSSFDRNKPKKQSNKTYNNKPDYTSAALKKDDYKGKKPSRGRPFPSRGGRGGNRR